MTTLDLLSAWQGTHARRAADPALFDTQGKMLRTFGEIERDAGGFERDLLASFPAHAVVAIQLGNHPAWPALLLACLRRQLVALPLERSMADAERETACEICHVAAMVRDDGRGEVTLTRTSNTPIPWSGHPPALLKLTSGTTAAPRAIRFRSEQLLADAEQICETMGIRDTDLNFGVIPVSHSYGLGNLILPLLVRGVPLVLSNDRMPRAMLADLARTKATVFAGMPVFYQAFCGMDSFPPLPELRLCLSAGAPLGLPVALQFREKFRHAIHSFYGSSECGGICYDREAQLTEPGFVGQPMEGATLELLDPEVTLTQIRVRSRAAGDGYFPQPDEAKLGQGQFVPDDLLAPTGTGFRIAGRVSDLINVAGKKVNPAEIEATLLRCAGVSEAVVFGRVSKLRNEEVAACVVAESRVSETDLLEFCRQRLSGWQVPKRIFFLPAIPVTERGKISRRALAAQFA